MPQSCVLCGAYIVGPHPHRERPQWQMEYRIVYRDSTGASVSGVGHHAVRPFWQPPRDQHLRWDDVPQPVKLTQISIMNERSMAAAHGYVIHGACWDILQVAAEPATVSLERLMSVCESLPCPPTYSGLLWGHDCSALPGLLGEWKFPWMDNPKNQRPLNPDIFTKTWPDPQGGVDVEAMLSRSTALPGTPKLSKAAKDCFSCLPWEICEIIAVQLPMRDVLSLRLASRTFWSLFSSFVFWSSRFESDGERGFLYEVRNRGEAYDVKSLSLLYHLSRDRAEESALGNRERTWKMARRVARLIRPFKFHNVVQVSQEMDDSQMCEAAGGYEWTFGRDHGWTPSTPGCRTMASYEMDVSSGVALVGIATLDVGLWDYVSGIRIVDKYGEEYIVGNGFENEVVFEVTALEGFRAAIGQSGVRALQVVGQGQQVSKWAGRIEGLPRTHCLVKDRPITGLRISLDGFKVTRLAVHSTSSETHDPNHFPTVSVRHTRQWYPDVPPTTLSLNEESLVGKDSMLARNQPLSWLHFGGKASGGFAQLRAILVQYSHCLEDSTNRFEGLKLIFDQGWEPEYPTQFGCCEHIDGRIYEMLFIDGLGGERIEAICIGKA